MSKSRKVKTTITEQEEIQEKNPIPGLIKQFLRFEIEYPDELSKYTYRIDPVRVRPDGLKVGVKGRVYENLQTIGADLAQRFGEARFNLLVSIYGEDGKKEGFVRIDDFATDWEGEEPALEVKAEDVRIATDEMQLARERHEHEIRIRQMDHMRDIMVAALQGKGSQGMRVDDYLNILNAGVRLGEGKEPLELTEGEQDGLTKLLGPLAQISQMVTEMIRLKQAPPMAPIPAEGIQSDTKII